MSLAIHPALFLALLLNISLLTSCANNLSELENNQQNAAATNPSFAGDENFPLSGETITSAGLDVAPEHVWSIDSGTENWSALTEIADNGREAVVLQTIPFVAYQTSLQRISGYTTTSSTSTPIAQWQNDFPYGANNLIAAKNAKTYAMIRVTEFGMPSVRRLYVNWYRSGQATPIEYEFSSNYFNPVGSGTAIYGLRISADGNTTVAWTQKSSTIYLFTFLSGSMNPTRIETLNSATGTTFFGNLLQAQLTPNGKVFTMETSDRIFAEDIVSGQHLLYDVNWEPGPTSQLAISDDGNTIYRSADSYNNTTGQFYPVIKKYVRQGNTYLNTGLYEAFNKGQINSMVISGDGKTLAYSVGVEWQGSTVYKNQIRIMNVSTTPYTLLYDEQIITAGNFHNVSTAIRTTNDGRLIAVGYTGDNRPEVEAYQRGANGQYAKILSYDTTGSVTTMNLSDDGHLIVSSRGSHFSVPINGGEHVDLFALEPTPPATGNDDLFVIGTPLPGNTVTLKMTNGIPNQIVFFLMAPQLAYPPVIYGTQIGLLYLNPYMLSMLGKVRFDAQGVAQINVLLPTTVSSGSHWYIQSNKGRTTFSTNYLNIAF